MRCVSARYWLISGKSQNQPHFLLYFKYLKIEVSIRFLSVGYWLTSGNSRNQPHFFFLSTRKLGYWLISGNWFN